MDLKCQQSVEKVAVQIFIRHLLRQVIRLYEVLVAHIAQASLDNLLMGLGKYQGNRFSQRLEMLVDPGVRGTF